MAKTINLHGHNYTVVNPQSEKAQHVYSAFLRSNDYSLYDAYGRFSDAKRNAFRYCKEREHEFNSYDGVITGHNTCAFSFAFTGYCKGVRYLVYITKDNDYAIEYDLI